MNTCFMIVRGEVLMLQIETARDTAYVSETNVVSSENYQDYPDIEEYLERHPELVESLKRGETIVAY